MSTVGRLNSARDLRVGSPHRRRRGDDLRPDFLAILLDDAEFVQRRLVQTNHRSQRPGDQMQFILDNQVRRQEPAIGKLGAVHRIARPVEASFVMALHSCQRKLPPAPVHGSAANLSTVAIMKHGSRR